MSIEKQPTISFLETVIKEGIENYYGFMKDADGAGAGREDGINFEMELREKAEIFGHRAVAAITALALVDPSYFNSSESESSDKRLRKSDGSKPFSLDR